MSYLLTKVAFYGISEWLSLQFYVPHFFKSCILSTWEWLEWNPLPDRFSISQYWTMTLLAFASPKTFVSSMPMGQAKSPSINGFILPYLSRAFTLIILRLNASTISCSSGCLLKLRVDWSLPSRTRHDQMTASKTIVAYSSSLQALGYRPLTRHGCQWQRSTVHICRASVILSTEWDSPQAYSSISSCVQRTSRAPNKRLKKALKAWPPSTSVQEQVFQYVSVY